jgi:pimeloyl-ACP methyl ester carboxylesterase
VPREGAFAPQSEGAPWNVQELALDGGGSLAYVVTGNGPPLLVPYCNLPWLQLPIGAALAQHFTVLFAAPQGYALSSRLGPDETYSARLFVSDLLAVCDAVGMARFSVLGYSLTAAVSAWLAGVTDRVDAVVAGGFPLLIDYGVMLADVRARTAPPTAGPPGEPPVEPPVDLGFDVRAAAAFYENLARLAPGGLLDGLDCPVFAFWGSRDEVLEDFEGLAHLEAGLASRGIVYRVLDGTDHSMTALTLERVLPDVVEWLGATRS